MASASTCFVGFGVLALASLIVNLGGLIAVAVKCPSNISWLFFFWGGISSNATCSFSLRFAWWSFAYQLFAVLLPLFIYKFSYFRPLRAASWAILTSACTFSAVSCNTFIGLSTWDLTKFSGIPPSNTAAYVGLALAMFFSFLMIISGSIMELSQDSTCAPRANGGTETTKKDGKVSNLQRKISDAAGSLFESVELAKKAFAVCMALAVVGWVLTLAGVASVQAYCSLQPDDMAIFRLPLVYYPNGSVYMNCATVFSGQWWAWTLMTVTLVAICLLAKYQELGRFKAATWALLISSITFNFYWIDVIISWDLETSGTLRSRIQLWSAGYIIYEIAGFGLLFVGSAYIYATSALGQQSTRRGKSFEDLANRIFNILQVLSIVALIIALVGTALYQYAMTGVVESQFVFSLRFTWTAWALSFAANVFLAVVLYSKNPNVKRLKTASQLFFTVAAVTSMTINCFLFAAQEDYQGDTLKYVKLSLAGFVTWCAIAYLMLFAGSAIAFEGKDIDDIEASAETSTDTDAKQLDAINETALI